ncbi:uncharacterized protein LOC107788262 isoform X2 [Nicotiana tabacum]
MLQNRPNEIPEVQFRQFIEYWDDEDVQRATKENNEELSKSEMFITTRTKKGRKFIQILKLQYLNFRIVKVPKKQQMMHLGLYLERSSLVGLDAMVDR